MLCVDLYMGTGNLVLNSGEKVDILVLCQAYLGCFKRQCKTKDYIVTQYYFGANLLHYAKENTHYISLNCSASQNRGSKVSFHALINQ